MKNDDAIPSLVYSDFASDPPLNLWGFELIAAGDVLKADNSISSYAVTIYPWLKGNRAFNAETIYWSLGQDQTLGFNFPFPRLSRSYGRDERIPKIAANFLRRCGIEN